MPNGLRLLTNRMPPYPEEARRLGQEGRVILWLHISAGGRVLEAEIRESSGYPLLDDAALRWAATLRFRPARVGMEAVETEGRLPVRFRLSDTR